MRQISVRQMQQLPAYELRAMLPCQVTLGGQAMAELWPPAWLQPKGPNGQSADQSGIGMMLNAYCVRCKRFRIITDPHFKRMRNGSVLAQAACPVCGAMVSRFVSAGPLKDYLATAATVGGEPVQEEPEVEGPRVSNQGKHQQYEADKEHILEVCKQHGWVPYLAARELGMAGSTLYGLLKEWGIDYGALRKAFRRPHRSDAWQKEDNQRVQEVDSQPVEKQGVISRLWKRLLPTNGHKNGEKRFVVDLNVRDAVESGNGAQ